MEIDTIRNIKLCYTIISSMPNVIYNIMVGVYEKRIFYIDEPPTV